MAKVYDTVETGNVRMLKIPPNLYFFVEPLKVLLDSYNKT